MTRTTATTPHDSKRNDRITGVVGLVLLGALLLFQLSDLGGAFGNFNAWWIFAKPVPAGDDYAKATVWAESPAYYAGPVRSITVAMAIRRASAVRDFTTVAPEERYLLWADTSVAYPKISEPGLYDWFDALDANSVRSVAYDPVLPDALIARWESENRMWELPWDVVIVGGDVRENPVVVLHTNADRSVIYVVPSSLSPEGEGR